MHPLSFNIPCILQSCILHNKYIAPLHVHLPDHFASQARPFPSLPSPSPSLSTLHPFVLSCPVHFPAPPHFSLHTLCCLLCPSNILPLPLPLPSSFRYDNPQCPPRLSPQPSLQALLQGSLPSLLPSLRQLAISIHSPWPHLHPPRRQLHSQSLTRVHPLPMSTIQPIPSRYSLSRFASLSHSVEASVSSLES